MNNKTQFKKWLSLNPPKKIYVDTIIQALEDGSDYCCSHGISKVSFWDITDQAEFRTISSKLLGMRLYRLIHRSTAIVLDKAMPLYREFLISLKDKSNQDKEDKGREVDSQAVTNISETAKASQTHGNYSTLYQKLYSISKVYDDPSGLSLSKIMKLLGNGADEQQIKDILDEASWAVQLGVDIYSFSPKTVSLVREKAASNVTNSAGTVNDIDFYNYLHDKCKISGVTCRNYVSTIKAAEDYALYHGFSPNRLYGCAAADTMQVIQSLKSDAGFIALNTKQHNRFFAAFTKLIEFFGHIPSDHPRPVTKQSGTSNKKSASNAEIKTVDLSVERSYAFTTPISFSYFGDKTAVSSWKDLYTKCVTVLLDDYPSIIQGLLDKKVTGFGDANMSKFMVSPQKILDDIFIETNRSATDLMKRLRRLIDLCNIDYENVIISYYERSSSGGIPVKKDKIAIDVGAQSVAEPNDYDKEKFVQTLMQRYRNGMQFDSIDFENFRETYELLYDERLTFNDTELEERLRYCGVSYKDRLFPAEGIMDAATGDKLFAYINSSFSSGKKVLYYKAIFEDLADTFANCFTLSDENMLRAYIEFTAPRDKYYFFTDYIAMEKNISIDHTAEVEEYMLSVGKPIAITAVYDALSHIPNRQIDVIIQNSNRFLRNAKGVYFHVNIFDVSEEDLDSIAGFISENIQQNEYAIWTDIWNEIQENMPAFIENNLYLSSLGIRNAVAKRFIGRFNFDNAVISMPKDRYTMSDIYQLYAKHHDEFSADDIYRLSKELDTDIYFGALAKASVRVSYNLFVSKNKISFDVDAVDKAVGSFMSKDYIRIREIDSYLVFPNVGYEWNEYLLESFVHSFSKKYSLLNNGFSLKNVAGAIVKKTSSVKEFDDVCAAVLADAPISLNNKEALNYLAEVNMITRRSYRDLDSAVRKASRIRTMKG